MRRFSRALGAVVLAGCLALATLAAGADGPTATAELDAGEAVLGRSLTLRVTIPGRAPAVIDVPELADWTVIPRGRAVGARGEGGAAVSAYRFELIPRREGALTFPALAVETGGTHLLTRPLAVTVRPRPAPPKGLAGQDLFLDATLSVETPYVGQTLRYTLRLYRAVTATSVAIVPPAFPGFRVDPLPGQRDGEWRDGAKVYVTAAVSYLLTPLRPGAVTLAAPTARLRGLPGRPNPLNQKDAGTVTGPTRAVTVRDLPPSTGQAPFTGLVGHMTLDGRLVAGTASGETVYVLTLAGRGNLDVAKAPVLSLPDGVTDRALPPEGNPVPTPAGYAGTRVFRYVLVAAGPGTYTVPPVALAVFDPEAGLYRSLETAPATWTVAPDAAAPVAVPGLHPAGGQRLAALPTGPWRLVWAFFPPGCFVLVVWARRRRPRRGVVSGLGPAQAAEALRAALSGNAAWDARRRDRGQAVLTRLDRLLYAGGPAAPRELEAARREALAVLRRAGA